MARSNGGRRRRPTSGIKARHLHRGQARRPAWPSAADNPCVMNLPASSAPPGRWPFAVCRARADPAGRSAAGQAKVVIDGRESNATAGRVHRPVQPRHRWGHWPRRSNQRADAAGAGAAALWQRQRVSGPGAKCRRHVRQPTGRVATGSLYELRAGPPTGQMERRRPAKVREPDSPGTVWWNG